MEIKLELTIGHKQKICQMEVKIGTSDEKGNHYLKKKNLVSRQCFRKKVNLGILERKRSSKNQFF